MSLYPIPLFLAIFCDVLFKYHDSSREDRVDTMQAAGSLLVPFATVGHDLMVGLVPSVPVPLFVLTTEHPDEYLLVFGCFGHLSPSGIFRFKKTKGRVTAP